MIPSPDEAQAIIERGSRARALLDNETFRWVVEDQTSLHLSAIVAAPPGPKGADAVAYHHAIQHALTELCGNLQGYAEAGEAMQRAIEAREEDD